MAEKKKDRDAKSDRDVTSEHVIKPEQNVKKPQLHELEELAAMRGVPAWELAGMMRAAEWAKGRQVSAEQFDSALAKFRKRPQGGGKIKC